MSNFRAGKTDRITIGDQIRRMVNDNSGRHRWRGGYTIFKKSRELIIKEAVKGKTLIGKRKYDLDSAGNLMAVGQEYGFWEKVKLFINRIKLKFKKPNK